MEALFEICCGSGEEEFKASAFEPVRALIAISNAFICADAISLPSHVCRFICLGVSLLD